MAKKSGLKSKEELYWPPAATVDTVIFTIENDNDYKNDKSNVVCRSVANTDRISN